MHAYIPSYQVQNMNIYQLKDKLRKIKTSVWYKNITNKKLLTASIEKAPPYVYGADLKNNQQNKKGGFTHELFS